MFPIHLINDSATTDSPLPLAMPGSLATAVPRMAHRKLTVALPKGTVSQLYFPPKRALIEGNNAAGNMVNPKKNRVRQDKGIVSGYCFAASPTHSVIYKVIEVINAKNR